VVLGWEIRFIALYNDALTESSENIVFQMERKSFGWLNAFHELLESPKTLTGENSSYKLRPLYTGIAPATSNLLISRRPHQLTREGII